MAEAAETFVEVGHCQVSKRGHRSPGDVFLSRKAPGGRILSVLSDGLGSGIKAGVLATLTASMAARFMAEDIPIQRAAGIIMRTLPVCRERRISYATFTIVDIDRSNLVRIIEYDNPPYALIREDTLVEPLKSDIEIERVSGDRRRDEGPRTAVMRFSEYRARPGDRVIVFSDGVPQSGMGTAAHPLGWGNPDAQDYALALVREQPLISARELARRLVQRAEQNDCCAARDDISCGVIYFRAPRRLLLVSGPSVHAERDSEMAQTFSAFPGRKVLCGGTTAAIVARELGVKVSLSMKDRDPELPPPSTMDGADLVTEGILTLGKVAELLEEREPHARSSRSPAARLVELLLDSDRIDFLVGTKINEAHQDPSVPVELEIRRNIIKRIAFLLEERHLKDVTVRFI